MLLFFIFIFLFFLFFFLQRHSLRAQPGSCLTWPPLKRQVMSSSSMMSSLNKTCLEESNSEFSLGMISSFYRVRGEGERGKNENLLPSAKRFKCQCHQQITSRLNTDRGLIAMGECVLRIRITLNPWLHLKDLSAWSHGWKKKNKTARPLKDV